LGIHATEFFSRVGLYTIAHFLFIDILRARNGDDFFSFQRSSLRLVDFEAWSGFWQE
jgi:hypothetical protein